LEGGGDELACQTGKLTLAAKLTQKPTKSRPKQTKK
jgi:hypothetical protein